jgi:hypothetical protein
MTYINNILFVTFFGRKEYIDDIITAFEENNIKCYDFPLLEYKFSDKEDNEIYDILIESINKNKITEIFWFFIPEKYNILLKNIKEKKPEIKYIFYNFDDPHSFNIELIKFSNHIDYFINPVKNNELKYSCIMDKQIYTLEKYFHKNLLLSNNNITPENDIAIIVNNYKNHNEHEKIYLNQIIMAINDYCIDQNYTVKLYGDYCLEDQYPDIYEDEIDSFSEGIIYGKNKLLILLCYHNIFNHQLINILASNKKVMTNYTITNDNLIKNNNNIEIITLNNIPRISEIVLNLNLNLTDTNIYHQYEIKQFANKILQIINNMV